MFQPGALFLGAIVLGVGCKAPTNEEPTNPSPKPLISFKGKVDPKFAGSWKSVTGSSTIDLGKDGTLNIETISNTPRGKSDKKVAGHWLADGDNLDFQYSDAGGPADTIQYKATLHGSSLTLGLGGNRLITKYTKAQ